MYQELQLESNGKEKHLYAMERAEKFALLILTLITRYTFIRKSQICAYFAATF